MNCDYPLQATLGRTHQISFFIKRPPPDKAHWIAGFADESSTLFSFALAWIILIIESLISCRQTIAGEQLKCRRHGKAERLARFAQQKTRRKSILRQIVGKQSCSR